MPRLRFPVGREAYEWFNSSVKTVPSGPGIVLPSIPLAQAIKWAWRVRRWTVSVSGTFTKEDPAHTMGKRFTFSGSQLFSARTTGGGGAPGSETDLMTFPIDTFCGGSISTTELDHPYTGTPAPFSCNASITILGTGDPCAPDPSITGNVFANVSLRILGAFGGEFTIGNDISPTDYTGFGYATSHVTLDGVSIPVLGYFVDSVETSVAFNSFVFTITPTLFWTYDGIYDPTTGAQLQAYGQPAG